MQGVKEKVSFHCIQNSFLTSSKKERYRVRKTTSSKKEKNKNYKVIVLTSLLRSATIEEGLALIGRLVEVGSIAKIGSVVVELVVVGLAKVGLEITIGLAKMSLIEGASVGEPV